MHSINDHNNVVLNNRNCNDSFVNSICSNLEEDGLDFTLIRNFSGLEDACQDISRRNIVITFNQDYYSGTGMIILANNGENRSLSADLLAVAFAKEAPICDVKYDGMYAGKKGYAPGGRQIRVKTTTEELTEAMPNTDSITLCFGTNNTTDTRDIATMIISAIAAKDLAEESEFLPKKVMHKISSDDDLDDIARDFNTTTANILNYNKLDISRLDVNNLILNPGIENIPVFSESDISIEKGITK